MQIKRIPISTIRPAAYNPRVDLRPGDPDYEKLRRSIDEFGFVEPLVWNERTGSLVGGHQRLKILRARGDTEVEVSVVDLDPDREKALNVALNKVQGAWDEEKLAVLLEELEAHGVDLALTGFDGEELEELLADRRGAGAEDAGDEDELPELPDEPVTRPGDLILLGDHRLLCGDAKEPEAIRRLLDGRPIDLLVTSPPYNVGIKYRSYDDREAERDDYLAFLEAVLRNWRPVMGGGRLVAWNVGVSPKTYPYRQALLLEDVGLTFYRQLVWVKKGVPVPTFQNTRENPEARRYHPNYRHEVICLASNGEPAPMRYDPEHGHELIYLFSQGHPEFGSPIMLPGSGESDVWDFIHQATATQDIPDDPAGGQRFGGLKRHPVKLHPATFPVALPQTLIGYLTAPGELVADPFGGAGTTILAAEKMRRTAVVTEIDPAYCDLAVTRWERMTGKKAVREHA